MIRKTKNLFSYTRFLPRYFQSLKYLSTKRLKPLVYRTSKTTYLKVGLDGDVRGAVGDQEPHGLVLDQRGSRSDVLLLHGGCSSFSPCRLETRLASTGGGHFTRVTGLAVRQSLTGKLSLYFHTTHCSFVTFVLKGSNYIMETTRMDVAFNHLSTFVNEQTKVLNVE